MPPSSRQRTFMRILVLLGAVTFFARCMDQAGPYWKVISGANRGAPPGTEGETSNQHRPGATR